MNGNSTRIQRGCRIVTNECYLGLDFGSAGLAGIVIDASGRIRWQAYRKVQGRSRDGVVALCRELVQEWLAPQGGKVS